MSIGRRGKSGSVLGLLLAIGLGTAAGAGAAVSPQGDCADLQSGLAIGDDEGKDPGECADLVAPGAEAQGLAPPQAAAASVGDTDVSHYFLDLEVIPVYTGSTVTAVRVEGVNTIDFTPTVDGVSEFGLDLRAGLVVNSVGGDVAGWTRVGDRIEISLDRAYSVGEPIQVVVDYEGHPQSSGFGAFRWWTRNGELVVATLSQPFFAHYWWPCKDSLGDKATFEMHVTVPSTMVALSNGVEVGSQALAGNRTRYLWHETSPMIPYLASLAITSYERYDLSYDYDDGGAPASMPVECHVYPDHWNAAAGEPKSSYKSGCDELPTMLATLASRFGEYPWIDEKYGVVETGGSGGLSASMEHQTLSSMARVNDFSDIMAHELAHQWWGDEVTCATWYDIWLNEGFASYSEALYREARPGGSVSSYWQRMNQRRPSNPDAQVYRTAVSTTGQIFSTNSVYNKGAWVLHMLRHLMGDVPFWATLAEYRSANRNDSATTADFSAAASSRFGVDLDWFFDQWVMNPGSPDYEWSYDSQNVAGQDYLKLVIRQTQGDDGYPSFTMPIDLRVTTAAGSSVHRIWNDDWTEYYVLPLDGAPTAVEFDAAEGIPDRNWLLFDSRSQVSTPVSGPPVLLAARFVTGAAAGGELTVTLRFSEDIGSFDAADLQLTDAAMNPVAPISIDYDFATQEATVAFAALAAGSYQLEIFAVGISANGHLLDGETQPDGWWDTVTLPSGDGQPGGNALLAVELDWPECSDALDNDADGWTDYPDDPGCLKATSDRENPECQDGMHNDEDGLVDFDGGLSVLGYALTDPDPECVDRPWRNREASGGCGLGFELLVLAPLLRRLERFRRAKRRDAAHLEAA